MTTELLQNGTLKIEAYSFAEFLAEYQEAVLNGYTLDLDTNEHFPQKYGDHLFVILKSDQWQHIGESEVYKEVIANTVETMAEVAATFTPQDEVVRTPRKPRSAKE